jgi:hypothetical protein
LARPQRESDVLSARFGHSDSRFEKITNLSAAQRLSGRVFELMARRAQKKRPNRHHRRSEQLGIAFFRVLAKNASA